jgi:hypothetical protein
MKAVYSHILPVVDLSIQSECMVQAGKNTSMFANTFIEKVTVCQTKLLNQWAKI